MPKEMTATWVENPQSCAWIFHLPAIHSAMLFVSALGWQPQYLAAISMDVLSDETCPRKFAASIS
jgi:hypothetical protein